MHRKFKMTMPTFADPAPAILSSTFRKIVSLHARQSEMLGEDLLTD